VIDSRTAAHKAIYAKLTATAAVMAAADVWGHPEEGTEPTPDKDLVLIGPASAQNMGGKDGDLDEVTITVFVEVRKPDITELYSRSGLVRNALERQPIEADGALLSAPEFVGADPELLEDGETFIDALRFRTIVQPAD
jgi:hypothetical protein